MRSRFLADGRSQREVRSMRLGLENGWLVVLDSFFFCLTSYPLVN